MNVSLTLESLGFTNEELQDRVVDQLCASILSGKSYDEDGNESYDDSQFKKKLEERLKAHIDATVTAIADKHVLPNVTQYIENLTIRQTNKWGEKSGKTLTFVEYLTERAEAYMSEQVNFEGKSKTEADSYSWSGKQTRITHLVEKHLHYSIETAIKGALQTANTAIANGITETVRLKLGEMATAIKIGLEVKEKR